MSYPPASHQAGFVSILGLPNAGKSTLLNALLGTKISIVTHKAQTTRHSILGILSTDDYQMVFVDTPGIIKPRYGLQTAMMQAVDRSIQDAEVVLWVITPDENLAESPLVPKILKSKLPVVLAVNKADTSNTEALEAKVHEAAALVPLAAHTLIAALHQFNLETLKKALLSVLPISPPFYDRDQLTDRPERFFVAEIIREKILFFYEKEIPYSTEVSILVYEEREGITHIDAEIHVERQSQKGILIGKGGIALKKIGTRARTDIEAFLGTRVFLNLYVRVAEGWKDSQHYLRGFGYKS